MQTFIAYKDNSAELLLDDMPDVKLRVDEKHTLKVPRVPLAFVDAPASRIGMDWWERA